MCGAAAAAAANPGSQLSGFFFVLHLIKLLNHCCAAFGDGDGGGLKNARK